MNVSDYIAKFFDEHNIKDIFLLDGSAIACVIVSVARNKSLKYYCPQHEQAGSFAVDGYYKASGKVSAMLSTSGPGSQNVLNGVAASYYDSVPAMYITGNINSRFMKPSDDIRQHGFQESDIVAMARPVTKYAVVLKRPEHVRYELEKAFCIATKGRPGPVLIDIPMDIQKAEIEESKLMGYENIYENSFNKNTLKANIDKCIEMIKASKRPVILIGGGVVLSGAVKETKKLIETLKIPFYVTWNMIEFCTRDDAHYGGRVGTFGGDGRNFGIQNSDLVFAIGSRISGRITGGMINAFAREAKKIIVDIDPEELRWQQVKGDLNIPSDAKLFVTKLQEAVAKNKITNDFSGWLKKAIDWKYKYPVVKEEYREQKNSVNPYIFVKELSDAMKNGDVLVHEAGGNCVITSQAFEAKDGQKVFTNNGNSSLGYALPAAIGACVATGKQVICITGDGGLNFNIQEFQTLKHYKLPVKVMIFNNQAFGITKAFRDTNFKSEYAGVDAKHGQSSPDFIEVAKAYGIKSVKINDHNDMKMKIKEVLDANEPVICDINMVGFYNYNPKLGWRNPIEDQYPFLSRKEFRENMIIEPLEGWENPVYP